MTLLRNTTFTGEKTHWNNFFGQKTNVCIKGLLVVHSNITDLVGLEREVEWPIILSTKTA